MNEKDKKNHNQAQSEWKKKNPDYQKEWYEKNKERILKKSKTYYQENKEKIKECSRDYSKKNYQRDKGKRREYKKKWIEENKEKFKENNNRYTKEYHKNHREKRNNYLKTRYKIDKSFRIIYLLRNSLYSTLKKYTKTGKIMSSKKYEIDYKAIIEHLKPFPKDISKYDIHHIKELHTFHFVNPDNSTNLEEVKIAFAPENHMLVLREEHKDIHRNRK